MEKLKEMPSSSGVGSLGSGRIIPTERSKRIRSQITFMALQHQELVRHPLYSACRRLHDSHRAIHEQEEEEEYLLQLKQYIGLVATANTCHGPDKAN